MNCTYKIQPSAHHNLINLHFVHFHLEVPGVGSRQPNNLSEYDNQTCWSDYLVLITSTEPGESATRASSSHAGLFSSGRRWCGEELAGLQVTFSNVDEILIHFVSDGSISAPGFLISYASSFCGWVNNQSRGGAIQTPNFPSPYHAFADCIWTIIAPEAPVLNPSAAGMGLFNNRLMAYLKTFILEQLAKLLDLVTKPSS
ncbi:unnamed protein product [Protopolystoma xenopodis]|uniref:CUB domain-containing protein n=1 Tax=Protopolystoma xenopodis TaxID=117903 RepID=A0A3S5B158_9PLAT|nr:unnamed protein product [Protopolystoma xenopodis]